MRCLAPQLKVWLEGYHRTLDELLANGFTPTPESSRKGLADLTRSLVTEGPTIARIIDDGIPGTTGSTIPVRIYHPAPQTPLPVLIYYHGGGHMAGSVAVYDPICRKMARSTNRIVVSADYRLAPEHPYPAGAEDAYAVARQAYATLDQLGLNHQKRLGIAGDSGGGALCATVAHWAQQDQTMEIEHQVLIYPSLDYTMSTPSIEINGTGYLLEKEKIRWYFDHYFLNNDNRRKASPLFMEVSRGLPQTLVVTAEFCPLRDEGTAYVEKIRAHGVMAKRLHFDTMIHAFLNMEQLCQGACDTTYRKIGRFLEL